jgi:hypothetical protein
VVWTPLLLTETLFIGASMGAIWLLVDGTRRQLPTQLAAGAVLLGAASLIRTELAAFIPVAAIVTLLVWPGRGRLVRAVAVGLLPLVLVVPWVIRNQVVVGVATLATESGSVLWSGYNPHAAENHRDGYVFGEDLPGPMLIAPTEAESYAVYMSAALREIGARPWSIATLVPAKAWNMFRPAFGGSKAVTIVTVGGSWVLLVVLAAIGIRSGRLRREILYVHGYVVTIATAHLLTIAEIRYRMPLEAAIAVPAGAGAALAFAAVARRWPRPTGAR